MLGIRIVEVNIHAAVEGLRGALEASPGLLELSGTDGLTRDAAINMPARIRMTTLYAAVGQMLPQGGRVANTCNLSEDWVGYSTKYGDAAGDFSPLSHLLVHEVRQIGHALRHCPGRSSTRRPRTASRARPTRSASASPMPLLDRYVLTGECPDEAVRARIDRLHVLNLHKLRLMPSFEPAEDARLA